MSLVTRAAPARFAPAKAARITGWRRKRPDYRAFLPVAPKGLAFLPAFSYTYGMLTSIHIRSAGPGSGRRRAPRGLLSLALTAALLLPLLMLAPVLSGCSSDAPVIDSKSYPMDERESQRARREAKGSGSIFGKDGLVLFGKKKEEGGAGASGVAVNSYLWRASLDTLSFMPLSAADPFGGVIITDWYTPPETPDRRFKANAYILDRDLRADGVRVTLFQQRREASGGWVDIAVDTKTATDLEDTILTRARQLRVEQASR